MAYIESWNADDGTLECSLDHSCGYPEVMINGANICKASHIDDLIWILRQMKIEVERHETKEP